MNGEKYKQALYRGELRIDCSRITLTQNTPDNPLAFTGNGYIYQLADGAIRFHMFPQPEGGARARALFDISLSANFLTKGNYFHFEAVAYGGVTWTCDAVRADPVIYDAEFIIQGGLYEICRTVEGPEGKSPFFLQVQIFQKFDLKAPGRPRLG